MRTEKEFLEYLNTIKQMAAEEGYDSLDETYVSHVRARFFGEDVVAARSGRILLREMKMSDLEAFYGFSDAEREPVLKAFLKETKQETVEHLKSYIDTFYPLNDYGFWSILDVEHGEIIGICGLGQAELENEDDTQTVVTDIGYYIRPESRRQGYAMEAVSLALEYARDYLELSEVYALVEAGNVTSENLLKKAGFLPYDAVKEKLGTRKILHYTIK